MHLMQHRLSVDNWGRVAVCCWKNNLLLGQLLFSPGKMGLLSNKQKRRICLPTTSRNCFFIIMRKMCAGKPSLVEKYAEDNNICLTVNFHRPTQQQATVWQEKNNPLYMTVHYGILYSLDHFDQCFRRSSCRFTCSTRPRLPHGDGFHFTSNCVDAGN